MGAGTGRLPVDVAGVLQSCKLHEENIREQEEARSEILNELHSALYQPIFQRGKACRTMDNMLVCKII